MDSLIELLCLVDDFCQSFLPVRQKQILSAGDIQQQRKRSLTLSKMMPTLIHFHQSHYRNFKAYYTECVSELLRPGFPVPVSNNRFVEFIPSVLVSLCVFLRTRSLSCKRMIVETVIDQLRNISQIKHSTSEVQRASWSIYFAA